MKVIVVDHHNASENPAEFHLNPKLHDPPSSLNTGAQLSWKLAEAVQIAQEGIGRDEHAEEALNLAGMGCKADMESVALHENRAFFWGENEKPVPGVRALATALEEDPENPGGLILTQAVLNLPKRTPTVSAADIGALLACENAEQAKPIVEKLVGQYEKAKPARRAMLDRAVAEVGVAEWGDDSVQRPNPDRMIEKVIIDDWAEYAGYSGPVAQSVASKAYKPAAIFVHKGADEHGQDLYKFSTRNAGTKKDILIGALIDNPAMREACQVKKENEAGEIVEGPSLGGHANVVSGTCTRENLPKVQAAMEDWAQGIGEKKFFSERTQSSEYMTERRVPGSRLAAIEQQASRLGPFGMGPQVIEAPRRGQATRETYHMPMKISVVGAISETTADPDNPNFNCAELTLDNGDRREVRFPADEEAPVGRMCEWILKVDGSKSPYYLRKFHDLSAA